jgi:hypothetical protein
MDLSIDIFLNTLWWVLLIFAVSLLVIYFSFPHTWSLINVCWDHYIMKRSPEYTIRRGLMLKNDKLYFDVGWFSYLRDRVKYLEDTGKRKFELSVLKDIVNDIDEFTPVFTGKKKNKLRGKYLRSVDGKAVKKRI